jgi:hypothetical protein
VVKLQGKIEHGIEHGLELLTISLSLELDINFGLLDRVSALTDDLESDVENRSTKRSIQIRSVPDSST